MIGSRDNTTDVFYRALTVCVLDTLEGQIRWVNRFSSGNKFVEVPFYYSMTGDENFLLDSFVDDIVSGDSEGKGRYIELNTDIIPRGHITLTSFAIRSDEFANPNVWLRTVIDNGEVNIKKMLTRVRAIPVTATYDLTILLSSELDVFKCSEALMDTLWMYKFMYFEYNFMNIDAVMLVPDTNGIEIVRDKSMDSDNNIRLKITFDVQTYYPAFRKDRVDTRGYSPATGMSDLNGLPIKGGFSDYFDQPGATMSSFDNREDYFLQPKRTRWFDNILKGREQSGKKNINPNDDNQF